MDERVKKLFDSAGVPGDFQTWFDEEYKRFDMFRLSIIAESEAEMRSRIEAIVATGRVARPSIKQRVALMKCWLAARSGSITDSITASIVETDDTPLSANIVTDLHAKWFQRHGIRLGPAKLLGEQQLARAYREMKAAPPRFSFVLLESIRLPCFAAEENASAVTDADSVGMGSKLTAEELYMRAQALFCTLSFVSIHTPDYLPFHDTVAFIDLLLEKMATVRMGDGQLASLNFWREAYATVLEVFEDGVNARGRTLGECVRARNEYEHMWTLAGPAWKDRGGGPEREGEKSRDVTVRTGHDAVRAINYKTQKQAWYRGCGKGKSKGRGKTPPAAVIK